jgi:putative SOS response-associated peptidase YedK
MCGRFSQAEIAALDREVLRILEALPDLPPRYNVAPSQEAAVLRYGTPGNTLAALRWGLVPSWARDPKIGYRTINARAETLRDKPAFRDSFAARRCVIPVDGFYEWQRTPHGKAPHFIRRGDGAPVLLAGLWDRWLDPERTPLETFTIVTTRPNAFVRPLHDRMPVVLAPADVDRWLDPGSSGPLDDLLVPCPDDALEAYRVSTVVNSPANDGPECIAPIDP